MFPRYLPLLARRGARITLACRPPLQPIFERVAGIDALLSPTPDQPLAKNNLLQAQFDAWVPLLSLPFHLENELAAVPAEIPYLSINPIRTAAWRAETAGPPRRSPGLPGALRVCLKDRADFGYPVAFDRSLEPADIGRSVEMTEVDWVNLHGALPGADWLRSIPPSSMRLIPRSRSTSSLRGRSNRSARHGRYDGGALGRRDRPSCVDHGPPLSALGLAPPRS